MTERKNAFAGLMSVAGINAAQSPKPAPATSIETAQTANLGKRSDPHYRQISVYVRKDLYKSIRRELFEEEKDFSDLLEEWIVAWAAKKGIQAKTI